MTGEQEKSNIIAWDVEIARPFPSDDTGWRGKGLGVSCIAAYHLGSGRTKTWAPGIDGVYGEELGAGACLDALDCICTWVRHGYTVVTWNGLSFDFPFLIEAALPASNELGWSAIGRKAALAHTDPGWLMVCQRGYMIKLAACAEALGLPGKTEGMSGVIAPFLWNGIPDDYPSTDDLTAEIEATGLVMGSNEARQAVIDYCIQDVITTAKVVQALTTTPGVSWLTKTGRRARQAWLPVRQIDNGANRLLTCNEAAKLPRPNTSWMTKPRKRAYYIGWALRGGDG